MMTMTWRTVEDHIERLAPYLVRVKAGVSVEDTMRTAVEKPFLVRKVPHP